MAHLALILDLDNTLYSWMDSYAPALRATIKYLAKEIHQPVPIIRDSFKKVFKAHKSVEVVNMVKELDVWEKTTLCGEKKDEIQNYAQALFLETFKNSLQLFPDVEKVLSWAKKNGIMLIAFSDARAIWADFRLQTLNLYPFFEYIYVLKDEGLPDAVIKQYPGSVIQYPPEYCKPSPDIYLEIIRKTGICNNQLFIIGDSKRKDISPASRLNLSTIWAKYGNNCSSSSKRLLGAVTPWTASQRASGGGIKPQYTMDSFSEIISILENNQGGAEECLNI